MFEFKVPSITNTAIGTAALYLVYCIYWEVTTGRARNVLIKQHGCQPVKKYRPWSNIFGLFFYYETKRLAQAKALLEGNMKRIHETGNTHSTLLLNQTFLVTTEPENLKTMQSVNFKHWGLSERRKKAFVQMLGVGIFNTDGALWQHSREMLRPNFVRSQIGDLPQLEKHVSNLIQAIPRDRSTFNLQNLFFRLTIDSTTEFLFGESTRCLDPGASKVSGDKFAAAWNRAVDTTAKRARFGRISRLWPNPQFDKDIAFIREFVDAFVEKAFRFRDSAESEKTDKRYVFLHELVKQTSDSIQVRSELLNVLLAGRDTTASLLSNVWFELAKRPDIWAKLRVEVDALGGQKPTFAQIKDMKYLRWVLNESLRFYPVVPGNAREALQDTVLPVGGGPDGKSAVFCPKGQIVGWSVYTMHRRKDFYGADADEFKPERWEHLRPGWEFLPFNGGPRICIGQQLALTEASYTTIRLMQEFKTLESRDPRPWTEWLTVACAGERCDVAVVPA